MSDSESHGRWLRPLRFLCAVMSLALLVPGSPNADEPSGNQQSPLSVIRAYLRATYARDFGAAYQLISAEDRKVRDVNRYIQQRGPYAGFLLEAARKLSEFIEAETLNAQDRNWRAASALQSNTASRTRKKSRRSYSTGTPIE